MENSNLNNIFGYIEGYYGNLLDWRSRKKIILKMLNKNAIANPSNTSACNTLLASAHSFNFLRIF